MIKLYPENKHVFTSNENLAQYIRGGRGAITLLSPSGVHHTYYYRKPASTEGFPDDVRFVYAVHQNKLFYVGMLNGILFRCTKNSRFLSTTDIVKGAIYISKMAKGDFGKELERTPMQVYHEGICCRCGRPLTTPKSIEQGIGPRCKKKYAAE